MENKKGIIIEWIILALVFIFLVFIFPKYILGSTKIVGNSMLETLHDNDTVLEDKIMYRKKGLNRFDIITFYPYGREEKEERYVKRIIGLPGETIQIKDGFIYINGEILEEHYGNDVVSYLGVVEKEFLIPENEYFVMGDNRIGKESLDSRSEMLGTISEDLVDGRVTFCIWPFNRIGTIE